jgi:hypothetical protein
MHWIRRRDIAKAVIVSQTKTEVQEAHVVLFLDASLNAGICMMTGVKRSNANLPSSAVIAHNAVQKDAENSFNVTERMVIAQQKEKDSWDMVLESIFVELSKSAGYCQSAVAEAVVDGTLIMTMAAL